MPRPIHPASREDATIAWFGALCFFLSTVEYMIPKPLPFLRLGLANLPILLSIEILPFPAYCLLVLIKILGQGLIGGTLFSYIFLFSAVGSASSAFVMIALKKALKDRVSWIGISVAGAFASNAAQLTLARLYIFGESAAFIAPPFIAVGAISGTLLGAFANVFAKKSEWYADVRAGTALTRGLNRAPAASSSHSNRPLIGIPLILALMFVDLLPAQLGIAVLGLSLVLLDSSRIRLIPTVTMGASIVLFNLFAPFGRVLWQPLGLPVTEGALLLGIKKALTVEGMVFISRWMLRYGLKFPGKAGALVNQAFDILGTLSSRKKRLDPKNLIHSIDAIMRERD